MKVSRKHRYVQSKNKSQWYFIEFKRYGNYTKLIIEPNMGFVNSIQERIKKNENS